MDKETNKIILEALKKQFFDLAAKEKYPETPEITQKVDSLQKTIREMQEKEKGN